MRKTAKIVTLAIAIFAGIGGTAHAEGFKTGVDLVSSFVWRGNDIGDSPAIQPTLSYTFPTSDIVLGAWGSYAVEKNTVSSTTNESYRYQEIDLSLTVPVGPFTVGVIDYYVPDTTTSTTRSFDFSKTGPNTLEADVTYTSGNLGLLAGYNFAGVDRLDSHAFYGEGSYKFYSSKDGYSAKAIAGVGSKYYYGGDATNTEKKLALVNTGISVSKDRFTASYVYNPVSEKSYLVLAASF